MKESKHTKGDWNLVGTQIHSGDKVIAEIRPVMPPEEDVANARLLEAAPRMLSLLKDIFYGHIEGDQMKAAISQEIEKITDGVTIKKIEEQIAGLTKMREGIPEVGAGGLNNHDMINAQIAVLKGEQNADHYFDKVDHDADEDENGMYVYRAAADTERWLKGTYGSKDLFEEMWFPENQKGGADA